MTPETIEAVAGIAEHPCHMTRQIDKLVHVGDNQYRAATFGTYCRGKQIFDRKVAPHKSIPVAANLEELMEARAVK